jgi:hypothetical protein
MGTMPHRASYFFFFFFTYAPPHTGRDWRPARD